MLYYYYLWYLTSFVTKASIFKVRWCLPRGMEKQKYQDKKKTNLKCLNKVPTDLIFLCLQHRELCTFKADLTFKAWKEPIAAAAAEFLHKRVLLWLLHPQLPHSMQWLICPKTAKAEQKFCWSQCQVIFSVNEWSCPLETKGFHGVSSSSTN